MSQPTQLGAGGGADFLRNTKNMINIAKTSKRIHIVEWLRPGAALGVKAGVNAVVDAVVVAVVSMFVCAYTCAYTYTIILFFLQITQIAKL